MKNATMDAKRMVNRYGSLRTMLVVEGLLVGVFAGLVTSLYRYLLDRADDIRNAAIGFCSGQPAAHAGLVRRAGCDGGGGDAAAQMGADDFRLGHSAGGSGTDGLYSPVLVACGFGQDCGGICVYSGRVCRWAEKARRYSSAAWQARASRADSSGFGWRSIFSLPAARLPDFPRRSMRRSPVSCLRWKKFIKISPRWCCCRVWRASLAADYISSGLFGMEPVFTFQFAGMIPLRGYAYILILGVLCGVLGAVHNAGMLGAQTLYKKLGFLPQVCRIFIPVFHCRCARLYYAGAARRRSSYGVHAVCRKSAVWAARHDCRRKIPVFRRQLWLVCTGRHTGAAARARRLYRRRPTAVRRSNWFGFDRDFATNLVIIAMAAFFAAIVRAPVTGIVLISELTGSFSHLLSLSTAALVAYVVAEALRSKPFFEHLTERFLEGQKGKDIVKGTGNKKSIITSVIEEGSEADHCMIQDLGLPSSCLVVSVTRGAEELIPLRQIKAESGRHAGDYGQRTRFGGDGIRTQTQSDV